MPPQGIPDYFSVNLQIQNPHPCGWSRTNYIVLQLTQTKYRVFGLGQRIDVVYKLERMRSWWAPPKSTHLGLCHELRNSDPGPDIPRIH